jgi:drug/metabolite transporter (DMT)-like permease
MVAALCYGIAAVMQAMAVRAASRRTTGAASSTALGRVDPGLVLRMLHQWRFIASLALDLVGFVAQLIALRRLPLFAVQAMIAANLAVTAVVAAWLMRLELAWREWLAVAGVVVGVGMLGSSAGEHVVTGVSAEFKLALILAVAGIALIGVVASRRACCGRACPAGLLTPGTHP